MREHWIFVEFIQKHALTNKILNAKSTLINNLKKDKQDVQFCKRKKKTRLSMLCALYMLNCSSYLLEKDPVLIKNG